MSDLTGTLKNLRKLRKAAGYSQKELSDILFVNQTAVSQWERGATVPSSSILLQLCEIFKTTIDYLFGRTNDPADYDSDDLVASIRPELLEQYGGNVRKALAAQQAFDREAMSDASFRDDIVAIPILGRVQAGVPVEAVQDIIGYERIPADMAMLGKHFALRVNGDSMSPGICEGDLVVVRQQSSAENGDTVVVLVNGEDATIKRFLKTDTGIKLVPLNPTYEPLFFSPTEVEQLPVVIIGKVVELRRKI